jgi:hypothetical protein
VSTAQTHHLGMPLRSSEDEPESRGYSYSRLVEMWRAANAIKSNLMMMWWTPEALYKEFSGTDAAFQKVLLPPPTQDCVENGVSDSDRAGSPEGACDDSAKPLELQYNVIYDPSIPDALRNPGHDAVKPFSILELQLNEMVDLWRENGSMREAVWEWGAEIMDFLSTSFPRTKPRVLQEDEESKALLYSSTILGALTSVLVIWTDWNVYCQRESRVFQSASWDFCGSS